MEHAAGSALSGDEPLHDHSILDDLGAEVTGIALPVSVCMALVIALVRLLNRDGENAAGQVVIAEAFYREKEGDSTGSKLTGSVLNAIIFVAIVTVMTFVIVLLFKFGCMKLIYGYMGFATFVIFFFMTGGIMLELAQNFDIHLDYISVSFMLYNFACVGPVILFFAPAPLAMKQAYLMWTGAVVAFIFTSIPSWTTWVLLVAMAIYDLFAVLTPHGPLQMLVNMAIDRDEDIPALVYEAREVRRPQRRRRSAAPASQRAAQAAPAAGGVTSADGAPALAAAGAEAQARGRAPGPVAEGRTRANQSTEARWPGPGAVGADGARGRASASAGIEVTATRLSPPVSGPETERPLLNGRSGSPSDLSAALEGPSGRGAGEQQRPADATTAPTAPDPPRRVRRRDVERSEGEDEDPYQLGIPSAVKLGLGDFIFYSVLVGRAAMYDWLTVYASFLSVISGLGMTLWLLAVAKKALPALPVSIALGVVFYFLSRYCLEPFVVPAFQNMAYW